MTDLIKDLHKCNKCKCYHELKDYINGKGRRLKLCNRCRQLGREYRIKHLCNHGKQKNQCNECNECIPNKTKTIKRNKPIHNIISRMVSECFKYDNDNDIYDANTFACKCFIEMMTEEYTQCYKCMCDLNNNINITRKDKTKGHSKNNITLCCDGCKNGNNNNGECNEPNHTTTKQTTITNDDGECNEPNHTTAKQTTITNDDGESIEPHHTTETPTKTI